jgi:KDO2-lipid IV(A) lauroyltransferase
MSQGFTLQQLKRPSFAPRNWGGWFMVALLWVLGRLPRRLGRWLVAPIAPLMLRVLGSRRRIAQRNIALALPELSPQQQDQLLRQSFRSLARMIAEMAWCWAGRPRDLARIVEIRGLENARDANERPGGILIVTAHVTCLEIGARALGESFSGRGLYRPLSNPVMEWYQNTGRSRYADGMIPKRDLRGAIRYLREGGVLWYAPDQDFGPKQSLFAPFFGVQTATLLATHRLPRISGCQVLIMMPRYDAQQDRYIVDFSPALEDFPSDDPQADLARINALLEAEVRKAPDQYWWVHRRFKTHPPGEPDRYGDDSRDRQHDAE